MRVAGVAAISTALACVAAGCRSEGRGLADADPAYKVPAIKNAAVTDRVSAAPQLVASLDDEDAAVAVLTPSRRCAASRGGRTTTITTRTPTRVGRRSTAGNSGWRRTSRPGTPTETASDDPPDAALHVPQRPGPDRRGPPRRRGRGRSRRAVGRRGRRRGPVRERGRRQRHPPRLRRGRGPAGRIDGRDGRRPLRRPPARLGQRPRSPTSTRRWPSATRPTRRSAPAGWACRA